MSLSVQGATARCEDLEAAQWSISVKHLPDNLFKWAFNAIQETLPTALNLCLWKKSESNQCSLCQQPESLCHVLNACPELLKLGLYKERHDNVLALLYDFIKSNSSSDYQVLCNLPSLPYQFPNEIALTTLCPDLVVYSCKLKKSWLLELSVPFEPVAEDTKARKHLRYKDLVQDAKSSYHTELLQLVIGSRGFIFSETKRSLARVCKPFKRDMDILFDNIIQAVIRSSYRCWINRKKLVVQVFVLFNCYFCCLKCNFFPF
ncbi:uncharacterized protein LOC134179413 [Corticium candelabrum]|uniref:uncharacterized protein LOC134179413 n=1 Tax=Corticium candelabrum TaxID=121492 RepID=UPI002E25F642|nr:uncharacterized protein LOC134179413 [Corticium candelabrum]